MKITILTVLLFSGLSVLAYSRENLDSNVREFAARYKSAQTPAERRSLCITAIDDRTIDVGVSVQILDVMFGRHDPLLEGRINAGKKFREYHFDDFCPSRDTPAGITSGFWPGWYLCVDVNSEGKVFRYWLTNIVKMPWQIQPSQTLVQTPTPVTPLTEARVSLDTGIAECSVSQK